MCQLIQIRIPLSRVVRELLHDNENLSNLFIWLTALVHSLLKINK